MVELVEKLDFLKEIGPYLVSEWTKRTAIEEDEQSTDVVNLATVVSQCQPKIVGQERNGVLLFTWHYPSKSVARQTMIELYNIANRKARLLFCRDKEMDVVFASINEEQSLLAFTVREVGKSSGTVSPHYPNEIYRSFVAEVQPQYRVFSLNIEWHTCQKVNFLYGQYGSPKVSHMIFIHHKSSIGLYHIPVCKSGDGSFLMSSQPKTEQVIREFVWCQFDQTLQRLYYVQLVSQDEEEINARGKFGAIEFQNNGTFKYILEFYLPLQFKMDAMHQTVQYFERYLTQSVSNRNFNMEVLTSSRSSFYVCYQHPIESMQANDASIDDTYSITEQAVEELKVKYTVCCVHGGFNLTSVVSGNINARLTDDDDARIFFTLFGDYVMALIPGHFLHLLDCSGEHEPVHHLFFHDVDTPSLPDWNESLQSPLLSISTKDIAPVLSSTSIFFENKTQKQYKFELNQKKICQMFFGTTSPTKRLALFHAAITHFRISSLTRKLIEIICQDPANTECIDLVKEYLLGSAYDEMKRKSPSNFAELKLLPFTGVDPFRGQLERDSSGKRIVHVSYKKFSLDLVEVVQNQLRKNTQKFWVELRANLALVIDEQFHRFPFTLLSSSDIEIPEPVMTKNDDTKVSLFKRISQATYRRGSAVVSGSSKEKFTESASLIENGHVLDDELEVLDEMRRHHTIELLNTHCNTCLPRESKTKIFTLCKGYADARKKAVYTIWDIVLKAYKYASPAEILSSVLTVPGSQKDCSLFQMIERISHAIWELCFQSFPNMQTIALTLAFRCLPSHLFMQYINNYVFTPTERFVYNFVSDLPDDSEDYLSLKVQLLSKLPKERSRAILHAWNHPIAKTYMTQQLMQLYSDEEVASGSINKVQGGENVFLPLSVLLHSIDIQTNGAASASKGETHRGDTKIDIDLIDSTALTETRRLRALLDC